MKVQNQMSNEQDGVIGGDGEAIRRDLLAEVRLWRLIVEPDAETVKLIKEGRLCWLCHRYIMKGDPVVVDRRGARHNDVAGSEEDCSIRAQLARRARERDTKQERLTPEGDVVFAGIRLLSHWLEGVGREHFGDVLGGVTEGLGDGNGSEYTTLCNQLATKHGIRLGPTPDSQ